MPSVTTTCPQCALVYVGGEIFCPGDGARLVASEEPARNTASTAPRDPLLGTLQSDRYRIVRRIGEGGMGIVYEAEHVVIEKRVALKVLREDFSHGRPDVVERFRQEAKSASRIGHENIVDISDFGITDGGAHFFVMELLQGHDLASELEKVGLPDVDRSLRIVITCARALGAAHEKGIVHRDMKPENIFLCTRSRGGDFVKIVDFGIAKMNDADPSGTAGPKLTKTGMIFGTPEYMSPEQASGKALDHRVDIYALGVILYELLTGRVPFIGDTFMGILTLHALEPVPPMCTVNARCAASPELEAIVVRAMSKSPAERFPSMEEFARALEALSPSVSLPPMSLLPASGALPGTVTHHGSRPPLAVAAAPAALSPVPVAPQRTAENVRKRAILWAGAGALGAAALVVAVALWVVRTPAAAPVRPPLKAAVASAAPLTPPAPPDAFAKLAAAAPVEAHAPTTVEVVVELDPANATLTADGATVCTGTPCSLRAAVGAQLSLQANAPGYRPSAWTMHAVEGGQPLKIKLKRKASASHAAGELMDVPQLKDAFGR